MSTVVYVQMSMYRTNSTKATNSSNLASSSPSFDFRDLSAQNDLYRFLKDIKHFKRYFPSIAIRSPFDMRSRSSKSPSSNAIWRTFLSVSRKEKHPSLSFLLPSLSQNKHNDRSSLTVRDFLHFTPTEISSSNVDLAPRLREARS